MTIPVPDGVKVRSEGRVVCVEGPKGKARYELPAQIDYKLENGLLEVVRRGDSREDRSLHGLARKLLSNMVQGTHQGFTRTLEIVGVGYRADVKGNQIHLSLGYSHPIIYQLPEAVEAKVEKQTVLTFQSSDRQLLGEVCAQVRALRPPEPYKGKGVKYQNERIRRKAGKAAGAGGR